MNRKHRRAQKQVPANQSPLEVRFQQGLRHMDAEEWDKAGECFVAVMKEKPDHYKAIEQIGIISKHLGQFEKAGEFFKAVIGLAPMSPQSYGHYATCMMELDRVEEAMAYFREALKMGEPPFAHIGIATCAMYLGDKETAKKHSLRALEMEPDNPDFLYEYINNHHKFRDADDPYLLALHKIEREMIKTVPPMQQALIFTLLHRAYEGLGDYDRAFSYARKAGDIRKKESGYNIRRAALLHQWRLIYFTKEFFAERPTSGCNDERPVFILGMPRSGTTLLEQILHAHPDIRGIGEDAHLTRLIKEKTFMEPFRDIPYLQRNTPLERGVMSPDEIAADHLLYLERKARGAGRVIDKAITNFFYAGIMHMIYPKARFIHIRRHPLDCCLSAFFRNFNKNSQPYTNNMTDLGMVYAMYCQLMDHWHRVLPQGKILDVVYEDIVEDMEMQARQVIDYLGLPWNDACLKFHESKKVVKTASLQQVRQPIYKSSMESWKRYEKHIGPLAKALGPYLPEDCKYLAE